MFIERYLNTLATLKKYMGDDDNDFGVAGGYEAPRQIKCRIDAGSKFKVRENQLELFNAYTYTTVEKIQLRDIIDGHVVIEVTPIYNFNGSISHYESSVGEATEL